MTGPGKHAEPLSQLCVGPALVHGVSSCGAICASFRVVAIDLFLFILFCLCEMDGLDDA